MSIKKRKPFELVSGSSATQPGTVAYNRLHLYARESSYAAVQANCSGLLGLGLSLGYFKRADRGMTLNTDPLIKFRKSKLDGDVVYYVEFSIGRYLWRKRGYNVE